MDEPQKPQTEDDLPIPFERVGQDGWADSTRAILKAYGVPLPPVVSAEEVSAAESRLGAEFPVPYRQLLMEVGLLDLDGIRFLPLAEVDWLTDFRPRARANGR